MDNVIQTDRVVSRRRLLGTGGASIAAGLGGAIRSSATPPTPRRQKYPKRGILRRMSSFSAPVVREPARRSKRHAAARPSSSSRKPRIRAAIPPIAAASSLSGGGTPLQQANGFDDTPENMYAYLELQMGPTSNLDRLRYYCENWVDHYNWLIDAGVTFGEKYREGKVVQPSAEEGGLYFSDNQTNAPFSELIDPMPRGHMMKGAGAAVYQALHTTAEGLDIQWQFNTRGERLIVNEEGRVVGVVVQTGIADPSDPTTDGTPAAATPTAASQTLNVKANKGVVLAAGGFQFNPEMLADHAPWYLTGFGLGGPHPRRRRQWHQDGRSSWRGCLQPQLRLAVGLHLRAR